jgi:8-oxo-dGTP pyrophosphatase MutT (NUDIX family)
MKSSKPVSKKTYYCSNCGKYGHTLKKCNESITSLGVICTKFNNVPINENTFKKFLSSRYLEIDNYNFSHIDNINKLDYFKKNIKFLMIQRKHSLSYIEFIRGKYSLNNQEKISNLFKHMSLTEIENISTLTFDSLWTLLWNKSSNNKLFQKEYKLSKDLFDKLKESGEIENLSKIKPIYDTPEWGFPKGRRNLFEKNLECALRELEEETTITNKQIEILNKINCVTEQYIGSNNIEYRHIYYLGYVKENEISDEYLNTISNYEVGKIGWFSWDEATELIRDYYHEKIKVINMVFFLFINLYIEYLSDDSFYEYS